jgi:hypothetical protein
MVPSRSEERGSLNATRCPVTLVPRVKLSFDHEQEPAPVRSPEHREGLFFFFFSLLRPLPERAPRVAEAFSSPPPPLPPSADLDHSLP